MKYFNTIGVTDPQKHYFLPHRLNWNQLQKFIEKQYYFILHAPRQSGKTTAIKEFVEHLNQGRDYYALYMSIQSAKVAVNDVVRAVNLLMGELKDCIKDTFGYAFTMSVEQQDILKQTIKQCIVAYKKWAHTKNISVGYEELINNCATLQKINEVYRKQYDYKLQAAIIKLEQSGYKEPDIQNATWKTYILVREEIMLDALDEVTEE